MNIKTAKEAKDLLYQIDRLTSLLNDLNKKGSESILITTLQDSYTIQKGAIKPLVEKQLSEAKSRLIRLK